MTPTSIRDEPTFVFFADVFEELKERHHAVRLREKNSTSASRTMSDAEMR